MMAEGHVLNFSELDLSSDISKTLEELKYQHPTPIQSKTIPLLLKGRDVLGQAQTGTGKTAAFALPILARLDRSGNSVQTLVLAPTRELAIQVSASFSRYAAGIKGFRVVSIYGGQAYDIQLRALKRGPHVVVGTPGRVMDHIRRKTLRLDKLRFMVLDEADEMLRMGFVDDVEWILQHTPDERQTCLFSATMPKQIQHIANRHLRDPERIVIEARHTAAETVNQRYWIANGKDQKLEAIIRFLEAEHTEAVLVFVRTRQMTTELSEKLESRGYSSAALSGDMAQRRREQTVDQLKRGRINILIATDVAARGLDIDRISHVINFDAPQDVESYIHRIGRTGRAGRSGEALLIITHRERRFVKTLERVLRLKISELLLPSHEEMQQRRIDRFTQTIAATVSGSDLSSYRSLMEKFISESALPSVDVAAALAHMLDEGVEPLRLQKRRKLVPVRKEKAPKSRETDNGKQQGRSRKARNFAATSPIEKSYKSSETDSGRGKKKTQIKSLPEGMERFRVEVGEVHGANPSHLVGALANEAMLDSKHIGKIDIGSDHSFVDLPEGMPKELLRDLKKVWVCDQRLKIVRVQSALDPVDGRQKMKVKKGKKRATGNTPKKHRKGSRPTIVES
jgi:ATP-dependent RNA helicase DeaD